MKNNKAKAPGRYGKMSPAELNAESDQYDAEFSAMNGFRTPTPAELAKHPKPRRGRPAKSDQDKAERVLLTMPPALLKQADAYAAANKMTRAGLFQKAVKKLIGAK